jgi:hypothetical protein
MINNSAPWIIIPGTSEIIAGKAKSSRNYQGHHIASVHGRTKAEQDAHALLIVKSPARQDFITQVANLIQDGQLVEGEKFVMKNDDAVETLNNLISQARLLLKG